MTKHRIYVIPGMFGFARLAGYDYCGHLEDALRLHFEEAGVEAEILPLYPLPTASLRRRAALVAHGVAGSVGDDDGPVHFVAHSTGGLDARLVLSPHARLRVPAESLAWVRRVRSVVTVNTPHHGTPLATYFATAAGTRLLYAVSMLTVATLTLGHPPLALLSGLVAAVGSLDERIGLDIKVLDRVTDMTLRLIGNESRDQVRDFFTRMRLDKGGILQITPEGMDLFNTTCLDLAGVRYSCVATSALPPAPGRFLSSMRTPFSAMSATIFSTLYSLAGAANQRYPYAKLADEVQAQLKVGIGREVDPSMNDGVVPTASMIYGDLIWSGKGDHLDVMGHFGGEKKGPHVDWLNSSSRFDLTSFRLMTRAISEALLGG